MLFKALAQISDMDTFTSGLQLEQINWFSLMTEWFFHGELSVQKLSTVTTVTNIIS